MKDKATLQHIEDWCRYYGYLKARLESTKNLLHNEGVDTDKL